MKRKIKYGKIAACIIITVLIWIWADLALEEKCEIKNATISVAKDTNPELWVTFNDKQSLTIENLTLKGPAAKIADIKRKINDGSLKLQFFFRPETQNITEPGLHQLQLLNFIRNTDQIKQLGLTVDDCQPQKIPVKIVRLIKQSLSVICLDDQQIPIKDALCQPEKVDMFVPEDWAGERLIAKVKLTGAEIKQARASAIEKIPYIELTINQRRPANTSVKITTPEKENQLAGYTITTARLRFSLSPNLQGKYKVVVDNLDEVMRTITIRATADAKRAYEKMSYQVILEIDDEDASSTESLRRKLIYNFPAEYLRRDEIRLNQQPVTARFKLIPLPSAEAGPGAGG